MPRITVFILHESMAKIKPENQRRRGLENASNDKKGKRLAKKCAIIEPGFQYDRINGENAMKNQNIIGALVGLCLLLGGCGQPVIGEQQAFNPNVTVGESQTREVQQNAVEVLKLPGDYHSLTASPWNCTDWNSRKATTLLYDSPVRLSDHFQAEPALTTVSGSGTQWTLTVREGAVFSDGSAVTAQDVNNSLTMAMAEGSFYRNALVGISEHRVNAEGQVEITLKAPDALFANLLTFPVAKQQGEGYLGTGRYRYSAESEKGVLLERNPAYWGQTSSIPKIELVELDKKDVATYSLKLREIDCLYTEGASGDIHNLSTSDYPAVSNQLIFLGANSSRTNPANPALRRAISRAIDREYLVQAALSTSASVSELPLHPNFAPIAGNKVEKASVDEARKILRDEGVLQEGETMELTLLYCTDGADRAQSAHQIAAQLAETGIQVTLDGRDREGYFSALNAGSYDLYLGEILLGDDMDLSHLFTRGERYGYGVLPSEMLMTAYQTAFATGEGWESFAEQFVQEEPVIPLAFRNGTFSFSRAFSLNVNAVRSDLFFNLDQWQKAPESSN